MEVTASRKRIHDAEFREGAVRIVAESGEPIPEVAEDRASIPGRCTAGSRRPGLSTTCRTAVRTGLPHATVVVDHFHVVQFADKMLSMVRRRTTAGIRGRRGRVSDPERKAGRRLLRNREDLTDEQFATMWNTLPGEGKIGRQLLTAWIAKENLRNLLALARTGADRRQVGHARWKFLTRCADSDIPEVRRLATTVDRWWPEIEAFIDTGCSNARSEGVNRVIKLVARNAFRFRTTDNQRLRTRCVTTCRARGHLRTAQL